MPKVSHVYISSLVLSSVIGNSYIRVTMEVFSFISSDPNVVKVFGDFLNSYDKLCFESKDEDTSYYTRSVGNIKSESANLRIMHKISPASVGNLSKSHNEIYFHFVQMTKFEEFEINYSDDELKAIRDFVVGQHVYVFDIQYRDKAFLHVLVDDFKLFLTSMPNRPGHFLMHPFMGGFMFV